MPGAHIHIQGTYGESGTSSAEADVCSHLAGRGLTHHRLVGGRQVCWVQGPRAVDGHAIDGTKGRVGEVQVEASVGGITAESQPDNKQTDRQRKKTKNCFHRLQMIQQVYIHIYRTAENPNQNYPPDPLIYLSGVLFYVHNNGFIWSQLRMSSHACSHIF